MELVTVLGIVILHYFWIVKNRVKMIFKLCLNEIMFIRQEMDDDLCVSWCV